VRNSLDHGIERPDARAAAGKPPTGTVTLRAFHQGGNIVIEVADDGAGLSRERILAKARERGLTVSDAMSDQEVWQLIFEPGFSTAELVTDVSGRGVGMDVVKRNIHAMGGRIEIDSQLGQGTRIAVRLPLTLAILDGMSVRVREEVYILPLSFIVESLQPQDAELRTVGGRAQVIQVRGEYLPLVSLQHRLAGEIRAADPRQGIVVIVEAEGAKVALLVDELLGQHQVVIKSLESNYRKVRGISGATIMGDGRVALILDVGALVREAGGYLSVAA
jgi:two-component system chemotaxis sensor kinase CheA